jgi:DNA-binding XRE family transcriptional regulator
MTFHQEGTMARTETAEDLLVVDLRGLSAGLRVRLRRIALGLSQWEAAQLLSTTQTTISLAERGRLEAPRQAQLEQALRALATRAERAGEPP